MRVILPSIKSRQLTNVLIPFSDPLQCSSEFWHYTIDILFANVSCHPLPTSNAMPGAQGYYVSVQQEILRNLAARLLSCITV